jgi:hypothetical protein
MDQQDVVKPAKGLLNAVYNDNAQEIWDNGGFKENLDKITDEEFKTSLAEAQHDPGQTSCSVIVWC